jgi:amicoumacin kinase
MDPKIAARFHDDILRAAMERYDILPEAIRLLDGFESFVYEFERSGANFVLRIGHSSRRSEDLIHGEVDWINFLESRGASVARAVPSPSGRLVEHVDDGQGEAFLCTAFVRAPGGRVRAEQRNDRFHSGYGRMIGKMHALAKDYQPSDPRWRRYAWDDPENLTAGRQMPEDDPVALDKYREIVSSLRSLPRERDGYGLIHQDAHPGNFFVDDDRLTFFDFDDCVYGHFINDLAMVLFYTSGFAEDPAAHVARFMPAFLSGYREENRLASVWLPDIPRFLKLREIELYAAIVFACGPTPEDPWCRGYLRGRRERIAKDVPFIEYEWGSLGGYL